MSTPSRSLMCPSCSAAISAESRFCSSCGQPIGSLSQIPTVAPTARAVPISSGTVPVGGFTPGTILADRYRIVGLVGRGGMGEVYRADDLKLGQAVALKFLPKALADDPVRRERFFAEVRITRQLSHPNICRVYDIAEFEGRHFLSMEFIDGEDLASLIRRIGHLSNEKTLEIARQLTAGLATAHEKGVLHRDLKPANIMIDGHGRVRITDFGIAIAVEDETQAGEISGTPAYMAPEQLAGKVATVRSDIYSLGLVLYELCSGKKAFSAGTLAELREQKERHTPRAPSDIRTGVDPILERLILRCVERDPANRPASVPQLAAALPGGDPLAAAIAAGQTPSPEMVAASGLREGLQPAIGVALVAFVILGLFGVAIANREYNVFLRLPAGKSPEHLAERSRELLRKMGYSGSAMDNARGYFYFTNPISVRDMVGKENFSAWWSKLEPYSLRIWYRESPAPLVHRSGSAVSRDDPPLRLPGEASLHLDAEGWLRELTVLPSASDSAGTADPQQVWSLLFAEAGFDQSGFVLSEKPWKPLFYADAHAAWEGSLPNGLPARIEAGAYGGKPVWFRFIRPESVALQNALRSQMIAIVVAGILILLAFSVGALSLARRNVRLGRGDRRGAARLALLVAVLSTMTWILQEHHVAEEDELTLFLLFVSETLLAAGAVWILYMALEPVIRRRWPASLTSWTRLLNGEWRDPLVGRDVLVGCAAAVAWGGFTRLGVLAQAWLSGSPSQPVTTMPAGILGPGAFAASLIDVGPPMFIAFGLIVAHFLLRTFLRKDWIVTTVLGISYGLSVSVVRDSWTAFVAYLLLALLFLFLSLRFGLLAVSVGFYVVLRINTSPMTLDTSAWYFPVGLAYFLFIAALTCIAFWISLGGRRLLQGVDD